MWAAMEHVSENEHNKLVELCQRNCWIKRNELAFRLQSLTEEMNGGHAGMTMKRKLFCRKITLQPDSTGT